MDVVLVPAPAGLPDTLTYSVPAELSAQLEPGVAVLVPLGTREMVGYVLRAAVAPSPRALRPVLAVVDEEPAFGHSGRDVLEWIAGEYFCSLSDALPLVAPQRHEARLERWLRAAPAWDGSLPGRVGPVTKQTARAIRKALAEAGGSLSREQLLARLPHPTVPGVLRRCRDAGAVIEEAALAAPRAGPLTAKAVRLSGPDTDGAAGRLGPRQREVLEFLGSGDRRESPLQREVCGELDVDASVVRRLQARGLVSAARVRLRRRPGAMPASGAPPRLTPGQQEANTTILAALDSPGSQAVLLFGVTGSGKTELYLRAIEEMRRRGRTSILLVPEISLTAQVAAVVRARLGERVAILHSALSDGERYDEWDRLRHGEADVVVGPRSALFAPLAEPGLIVVDEEHDASYKQAEPAPRYHAREVARRKAANAGGLVILGSATPAMESFYGAQSGIDRLVPLRERVLGRPLPEVQVVDLRAGQRPDPGAVFGELLAASLRERLARGEQAILFINRRGFSAFVLCRDCGYVPHCARCDVSLTLHRIGSGRLLCHYCGFERRAPERCPRCSGSRIRPFGIGTQRVEAAVRDLLPAARVARLDRDATRRRGSHSEIVEAFRARRVDVLVGTQMVTKGFDFPGVTLVGVVTADVALNTPDFRAGERAFQLLTQVSGRAGRGEQPGEVVVQTFSPGHPSIVAAARHDYQQFFAAELPARRELRYPPFGRLARLLASSSEDGAAEGRVRAAAAALQAPAAAAGVELLGPSAAPLSRLNDLYRWHLVLRAANPAALRGVLTETLPALRRRAGGVAIDVDPVDLL